MGFKDDVVFRSNFLTAEKDLYKIMDKFLYNENLKRLLYYPVEDALSLPPLTEEQTISLIHRNIRVIPKLEIDAEMESYIIITFDNFVPNKKNPQFRDNVIVFDIICHSDTWIMDNNMLRPYKIMGEIDGMLNGSKLNGIGRVEFMGSNHLILNSELSGFTIMYRVVNDV